MAWVARLGTFTTLTTYSWGVVVGHQGAGCRKPQAMGGYLGPHNALEEPSCNHLPQQAVVCEQHNRCTDVLQLRQITRTNEGSHHSLRPHQAPPATCQHAHALRHQFLQWRETPHVHSMTGRHKTCVYACINNVDCTQIPRLQTLPILIYAWTHCHISCIVSPLERSRTPADMIHVERSLHANGSP